MYFELIGGIGEAERGRGPGLRERRGAQLTQTVEKRFNFIGRLVLGLGRSFLPFALALLEHPPALGRGDGKLLHVKCGVGKQVLVAKVGRVLLETRYDIGVEREHGVER